MDDTNPNQMHYTPNSKKIIVDFFSARNRRLPKDRGAEARELARSQADLWFEFISDSLDRFDIEFPQYANEIRSILGTLAHAVRQQWARIFTVHEAGEFIVVDGKIPIISKFDHAITLPSEAYIVAAVLWEVYIPLHIVISTSKDSSIYNIIVPSAIIIQGTEYNFDKSFVYRNHETRTEDQKVKINKIISDAADAIATNRNRLSASETNFANFLGKSDTQFKELIDTGTAKIEAARALARESSTLDGAMRVWLAKNRKHNIAFFSVSGTLSLLVCAIFYEYLQHFHEIKNIIPTKSDGDVAYGFIILLLVPIISAAWVVRIFTRWALNSLLLSEDAEQRRAMIETYLRLVGDPEAKMEQADRVIILNALFRPLPGSAQEDISPPTLADFVKDAFSSKNK